jgi:hypothetical protein
LRKNGLWESAATVHSVEVDDPFAGSGSEVFVVTLILEVTLDVTLDATLDVDLDVALDATSDTTLDGEPNSIPEAAVFAVNQGKTVKEVYLGRVPSHSKCRKTRSIATGEAAQTADCR